MVDSLDLPSLSTKPSYQVLLSLLSSLEIQPSTWTGNDASEVEDVNETKAVNAWLPTIFRSDLRWFGDFTDPGGTVVTADEQREEIMDLAAKRLAERCGRSATSDITRTWTVPCDLVPGSSEDLKIQIHEPGLTEGNTGHKTWGTAFALIKQLSMYKEDDKFFNRIFYPERGDVANEEGEEAVARDRRCVLELGSGTGLLGIAAAAIWSCRVVLTDLEVIVPNLKRNMEHNLQTVRMRGGDLVVETLDWADHPSKFASDLCPHTSTLILASDPIYDTEQVNLLANTLDRFLDTSTNSRALVAVPLRDEFSKGLASTLEVVMGKRGFVLLNRGLLEARDDFGGGNGGEEVMIQRDLYARGAER